MSKLFNKWKRVNEKREIKRKSGPVRVLSRAEIDAMETMRYEERYGASPLLSKGKP